MSTERKHRDGQNLAALRNWLLDTAPTVANALGAAGGRIQFHSGGSAKNVAFVEDIVTNFRGTLDATTGIPTPAGSTVRANDPIRAGEIWRVSVAGTIAGLEGQDALEVNDVVYALADGANTAAQFAGMQGNLVPAAGGGGITESVVVASVPANTATDFTPPALAGGQIYARLFTDASGNDITDSIEIVIDQGVPKATVTSLSALSNITMWCVGTDGS